MSESLPESDDGHEAELAYRLPVEDIAHGIRVGKDHYTWDKEGELKKSQATGAEVDIRVTELYEMLRQGFGRPEMIRYAAGAWGVSSKSVDYYLAKARGLIKKENAERRAEVRDEIVSQMSRLYRRCYDGREFKTCLSILNSKAKLLGVADEAPLPETQTPNTITQVNIQNTIVAALDGAGRDKMREAADKLFGMLKALDEEGADADYTISPDS